MYGAYQAHLREQLAAIGAAGLYKSERIIGSPQSARIRLEDGREVINMCANNYLGLSADPTLISAAKEGLESWGYGLSSVRFICGTQTIHRTLELAISHFLQTEDTILYSSCFDANGGLFETLLGEEDAVITDELNHASIIDGIRLCKAKRLRYRNCDLTDLEDKLHEAQSARFRLIATDGVFSMDGTITPLAQICDLAEKYQALVMVDDSHAVGVLGANGGGTPDRHNCIGRVDIITGTLGKALGGASGGYTSGRKEIVELLRQRSRPYLFSNSVAPMIVYTSIRAIELLSASAYKRERLMSNTRYFRDAMRQAGFNVPQGEHPIIPVMIGDARAAQELAARMLDHGVYVIGFSYPVVPQGKARIRVQISAAHSREDLNQAVSAFAHCSKVRES